MAQMKIRGSTQIKDGSIFDAQIAALAAIATSKLADGAEFLQRDGSVVMTGNLDTNSNKIINLAAGVNPNDAVNVSQLNAAIQGLAAKEPVRVATTGDITLSNLQTVDGVSLAAGDRVLVKDQTTGSQNGVYVVVDGGAWTRADDFDADSIQSAAFVYVQEGTVNADAGFLLSTDEPITLGTTSLSFVQISGAGQIEAGDGLSKTGNVLDVNVGNGIQISSDAVAIKLDGTQLAVSGTGLKLADVTAGQILLGNASGVLSPVSITGDISISDAGVVAISSGVIVDADISATAAIATSKLADGAEFLQRDGSVALTADFDAGGFKLTNLADGVAATDAATVGQVDTAIDTALAAANLFFVDEEVPTGDINGVNTSYSLANTPVATSVKVYLNGLRLKSGVGNDYTVSGSTVTMEYAPETGDVLVVDYRWAGA